MNKRIFLILASVLLFASVMSARQKDRVPFELKKHEVSLSGAFWPGRYSLGYLNTGNGMSDRVVSVESLYDNYARYSKEYVTGSWSFRYTYNFTKVLAFSASLSYEGGWTSVYRRTDDSLVDKDYNHFITPMIHFRVNWLNRRNVRMYSGVGAGVSALVSDAPRLVFAWQLAAVGVTFGRSLFGFVECGAGTVYMGGCAGIGYRF